MLHEVKVNTLERCFVSDVLNRKVETMKKTQKDDDTVLHFDCGGSYMIQHIIKSHKTIPTYLYPHTQVHV